MKGWVIGVVAAGVAAVGVVGAVLLTRKPAAAPTPGAELVNPQLNTGNVKKPEGGGTPAGDALAWVKALTPIAVAAAGTVDAYLQS